MCDFKLVYGGDDYWRCGKKEEQDEKQDVEQQTTGPPPQALLGQIFPIKENKHEKTEQTKCRQIQINKTCNMSDKPHFGMLLMYLLPI